MDKPMPTCPYCGAEMHPGGVGTIIHVAWWSCPECKSVSPLCRAEDQKTVVEMAHAAAMQRWQEPNRVLTLDELAEMLDRIEPVYLEINGVPGGVWLGNGDEIYSELRDGYHGSVKAYRKNHEWDAEYGASWRCWLRRPTDEERKAARWEDD